MDYTRENFVTLLERNVGKVVFEGGRYYIKKDGIKIHNKEVAELIDYSERQFGSCLNPSDTPSYQTAIKRLVKLEEFGKQQQQLKSLKIENNDLKSENRKYQIFTKILSTISLVAILATFATILWLPSKLEKTVGKTSQANTTSYVVSDEATLDKIMEWHGQNMVNTFAWEAILINEKIKKSHLPLSKDQQEIFINETKEMVIRIIRKGRNRLHALGFVTEKGKNIADVLEKISPFIDLFKSGENSFSPELQTTLSYILNPKSSFSEVGERVRESTFIAQVKTWNDMKKALNSLD